MTALSSIRTYCLDVIKMAKILTREMSRAPVNICFFRIRLFSSKIITGGVYGVFSRTACNEKEKL